MKKPLDTKICPVVLCLLHWAWRTTLLLGYGRGQAMLRDVPQSSQSNQAMPRDSYWDQEMQWGTDHLRLSTVWSIQV